MKLLIVTQKVDATDSNLGFFIRWLEVFSKSAEIVVIANEVGSHSLPSSVRVYSLGKETGASRFAKLIRYQRLLLKILPSVDGVFFHMCPEYAIAAHVLPRLLGKRTAIWYVHKSVHLPLRIAEKLVQKVFTASKESFRLQSSKVAIVGHGIDTELFSGTQENGNALRLLSVSRISPVKDLRTLLIGFFKLQKKFVDATLSLVGVPVTAQDASYQGELERAIQTHGLGTKAHFLGKRLYTDLPLLYHAHTVFVHASRTGSLDKAVLEALAAGLIVVTSSEAFTADIPGVKKFREGDASQLAEVLVEASSSGKVVYNEEGREWVEKHHSLTKLVKKILAFYTK